MIKFNATFIIIFYHLCHPLSYKAIMTEKINDIIKKLQTWTRYSKTIFSNEPGIYAISYIGKSFPIFTANIKKESIIYIGKTESSQAKRDQKTHFATGKTGTSTLRRTIGAILCRQESLKPIPKKSISDDKPSDFKFNLDSEEKITKWMEKNLALSFYPYPKSHSEIEELETRIIQEIKPALNLQKNKKNPLNKDIKTLRKKCASIAHSKRTTI